MAVIAVMLSSIGTLETSILQFTRTMYAKGRDGVLHPRYALLHKTWRTPWVATAVIAFLGIFFLFLSSYSPTINLIIKDSVNAIGFQVAFYYGLAGLACAWYYRMQVFHSSLQLCIPGLVAGVECCIFVLYCSLQHSHLRSDYQCRRARRPCHWYRAIAVESEAASAMSAGSKKRDQPGRRVPLFGRNRFNLTEKRKCGRSHMLALCLKHSFTKRPYLHLHGIWTRSLREPYHD